MLTSHSTRCAAQPDDQVVVVLQVQRRELGVGDRAPDGRAVPPRRAHQLRQARRQVDDAEMNLHQANGEGGRRRRACRRRPRPGSTPACRALRQRHSSRSSDSAAVPGRANRCASVRYSTSTFMIVSMPKNVVDRPVDVTEHAQPGHEARHRRPQAQGEQQHAHQDADVDDHDPGRVGDVEPHRPDVLAAHRTAARVDVRVGEASHFFA